MARHKLTEKFCKGLTEPGVYGDGDGLWLRVRKGGSRQWIFVYRWEGKRAEISLGGYASGTAPVSLSLAREKAEAKRQLLARDQDPKAEHKAKTGKTFLDIMNDVIKVKEKEFRNAKHRQQWRNTLDTHAAPLHGILISKITVDDVVSTLTPIWDTIPETADRCECVSQPSWIMLVPAVCTRVKTQRNGKTTSST